MDSVEPGQDPSVLRDMNAVIVAGPFGSREGDFARLASAERLPQRIDGRFCPFCTRSIPEEFVFCTHCGRDV